VERYSVFGHEKCETAEDSNFSPITRD